jgi:hypothetical protein
MVGLHFKDILKQGNSAGLIFGKPLFRVSSGGQPQLDEPGVRRATPYHLEVYYRYQVTKNVSITPGAFVLFNPEGNRGLKKSSRRLRGLKFVSPRLLIIKA